MTDSLTDIVYEALSDVRHPQLVLEQNETCSRSPTFRINANIEICIILFKMAAVKGGGRSL